MKIYTFGFSTYDGKLVEVKIPSDTISSARKIATRMASQVRDFIDVDEGMYLIDEEVYS